ncbi:MAG: transglutaminase-like domain-containing protein [Anaerolineae bacterium]|jgi:hypothetical protein|nr:transglutaminase-like domain-containing protein [Anaerolineae bacterium]
MTPHAKILAYYAAPGTLTDPGKYADQLASLPADVGQLVAMVQQMGIYEAVAQPFYGVTLTEERAADIHLRSVKTMLEALFSITDQPLTAARRPDQRIGCRCHAFTKLIVTLLRAKGIPARSRCGFGAYFGSGRYEDHWVCEYWNAAQGRWVLLDAQLDAVWRERLGIAWDVLDMPRDQFLVAADAWALYRSGQADPDHFGISFHESYRGVWFIAGNLVRDAAALNKVEMLPWDVWGAAPMPDTTFTEDEITFYDHLAALTRQPDETFDALQAAYAQDERLRVPKTVFNNLRQRVEPVVAG